MTPFTYPPVTTPARMLTITHCYGPALRGEGPSTGQSALFVQLAGCDASHPARDTLMCRDGSRVDSAVCSRRFPVDELVRWAVGSPARLVVVTGGEPLPQQDSLVVLVTGLARFGQRVEIETNAAIVPSPALVAATHLFVVSPRLSSYGGGSNVEHRIDPAAVEAFVFSERAVFTFVVTGPADLDEISALEHCYSLYPIWVAPEGTTPGQVLSGLPWLADAVIDRGWHLSGRLQVLLQGDRPTPEHLPTGAQHRDTRA